MTMIFVSEKAKSRIERILSDDAQSGSDTFVRVSVLSGGCSGLSYHMEFDSETKAGDEIFEDNGLRIVTDRKSVLYLFGTTLDFSDGLNGKGFFFDNPNASRTCSCGESFAV